VSGSNSTAVGRGALKNLTSSGNNVAVGHGAGYNLTMGSNDIDIGCPGMATENT
jgi:hypothetical protein